MVYVISELLIAVDILHFASNCLSNDPTYNKLMIYHRMLVQGWVQDMVRVVGKRNVGNKCSSACIVIILSNVGDIHWEHRNIVYLSRFFLFIWVTSLQS